MNSAIPLTGLPFPKEEYDRRLQRVFGAIESARLDALVVTAHGHLRYLTGYHGYGAYFAPFPLVLVPGRAPTFVVREYEVEGVRAEGCIDDLVGYYHQADFAPVCADVLRGHGMKDARVGFELGCWNLAPNDLTAIQQELPDMKVKDATQLVASIAAVKSDLELRVMRDAMAMTDIAVRTFQNSIREGATEAEVSAMIDAAVDKVGGELRPARTLVFGERTKLPHGGPTRFALKRNEPAMIEVGGWKSAYALGLVRGAVLGRHAEAEELHAISAAGVEAAVAAIRPGVTAEEVDAAADKVIARFGKPRVRRCRTGYQTGIHWSERGNISLEPGAKNVLEPNMTLHMPFILFGEGGHLFGTSEHVVVTQTGAEILSSTPHTLFRA